MATEREEIERQQRLRDRISVMVQEDMADPNKSETWKEASIVVAERVLATIRIHNPINDGDTK